MEKRVYELKGALEGKTVKLRGWSFKNGRLEIHGNSRELDAVEHYFKVNWNLERTDNVRQVHPDASSVLDSHKAVDGPDRQGGGGNSSGQPEGSSSVEANPGEAGLVSDGNRSQASVDEEWDRMRNDRIVRAIASLDHEKDMNWTGSGRPSVAAVANASGLHDVTRAEIDHAAPDVVRKRSDDDVDDQ